MRADVVEARRSRALRHVVAELRDQRVDAVELALAAQEVLEADAGGLAVQVDVDVEQMRLQQ